MFLLTFLATRGVVSVESSLLIDDFPGLSMLFFIFPAIKTIDINFTRSVKNIYILK